MCPARSTTAHRLLQTVDRVEHSLLLEELRREFEIEFREQAAALGSAVAVALQNVGDDDSVREGPDLGNLQPCVDPELVQEGSRDNDLDRKIGTIDVTLRVLAPAQRV